MTDYLVDNFRSLISEMSESHKNIFDLEMKSLVPKIRESLVEGLASEMGRRGAIAKLKNDPKRNEKNFIHECWQEWQKKPENYQSQAAFGRDMLTKCNHLTSQKKIEGWCRE